MKNFKDNVANSFMFASAHLGTLALFVFLDLFRPLLLYSVSEVPRFPIGYDFITATLPGYLYLFLLPSTLMWFLMRRRDPVFRYLVVLSYNVQLFSCTAVLYTFCFYVIRLQYTPVLTLP